MSLLDILNSKDLGNVLGTILGGGQMPGAGQMPGGPQGASPYGQYGNAGRGGRDAGLGGADGPLGGLGGLDLGKLTQGGLGGGLGMLLGTLLGAGMGAGARSGVGGMAKNAALVGAGLAAWSFFKKWSAQRQQQGAYAGASADPFSADFQASAADPTAQIVVRSMVYAARADGHIDEAEQARIVDAMKQLFPGQDLSQLVNSLLREPVDAGMLASQVNSMEEAEDVYMMSCMAVDVDHPAERAYLNELAESFGMPRGRREAIEREAFEAKSRVASAGF